LMTVSFGIRPEPLRFSPSFGTTPTVGYIPDGMSAEQWRKLQSKEKEVKAKKKFGAFGPQSFTSRSLQSFQSDMEKGKTGHLLPVFNAKDRVKRGELKQEDIPYMQRGGNWDNSDVKGAKKVQWNSLDKRYNANQKPTRVDWMGSQSQNGGPKSGRGGNPPAPKKKTGWW